MRRTFLAAALLLTMGTGVSNAGVTYSYTDLVKKLTDLQGLAALPVPGEKCQQWSSYDRASKYDEATGKYVDWGANNDCCGYIRQEGDELVWAEMEGPGVIWRIWAATAGSAHVKIYLDGAKEPTFDMPFSDYFDGRHAPFVYPSLVHDAASGQNCYVPIPYQKSCKIVSDTTWATGRRSMTGEYFHIDYATYPKDTVVPTFTEKLSAEDAAALAAADNYLSERLGTDPAGKRKGEKVQSGSFTVPAGGKATIADLKGNRAITAIRAKIDPASPGDINKLLRDVVLQIRWDGEKTPSVWVPLGDFFGTAPGINLHRSLPCGMSKEGDCYSLWYMPFSKGANIELTNDGKTDLSLEMSITHSPVTRSDAQLGRFHAKWHRDVLLNTVKEREIDWPMLKTDGRGRFCGVMLSVWNPQGGWWGEGDEKFFVDGEKFPSFIGTGSEDYFGYAWCSSQVFQNAYHNQTISEGNAGCISVNRWHITDNVPFQTAFEGSIERYGIGPDNPVKYAATVYFYLAPGQADPYPTNVPAAERDSYYKKKLEYRKRGVVEAETAKASATGGVPIVQQTYGWPGIWSGTAHLWWAGPKPGDRLTLTIPVKQAGKYEVKTQLTKAGDYGIVQVYMDDRKLGDPVDLFEAGITGTGPLTLGTVELTAGDHAFTIESVGKNKDSGGYMAAIDYVKLELMK